MRHMPDVLFLIGLIASTSGVYLEKGLAYSLIYSGVVVLTLGIFSAFRVKN